MEEITLIIPAKNEPNALPIVLNEIKKMQLSVKILVVIREEDEDTFKATNDYDCDVLYQSRKGYGNAIVEGINHVKTKYSCIFYADGSTDPKYINQMREKLVNEKLDLIFGSRYEKSAHSYDDDLITRIGNFGFTLLGNIFMRLKISDLLFTYVFAKTDCLKNMKLNSDDYCLCVEIPFKAKLSKLRYTTLPCIERKRFADKKKVKAFGDGLKILIYFFVKYLKSINR
ncbi:glycosyltransferase family 2 protein [Candidatus Pelagibacter sp.]|nr:glycosyltransferase family 2 protein [Candidatus Pelagibacter sp.]